MTVARRPFVVAFDLGGVLVDVDKTGLASFGPPAVVDAAFHGPHHDAATVGVLDDMGFAEAIGAALRSHGRAVADNEARRAWAGVVAWRPGATALLATCAAAVTTHVWSNTDPIHWSVLGPAIDGVVHRAPTSFRVGAAKPDPAFFLAALGDIEPTGVLFLDDRADNVAAACALGIDAQQCTSVAAARACLRAAGVLV
jgi:2-haloacid dehalogenase